MEYFLTKVVLFIKETFSVKENRVIAFRLLCGIAIICGGIYLTESCKSCASSSSYSYDVRFDAYVTAKGFIEKTLKAPYSAKYQKYDNCNITISGNIYTVSMYVDAQNPLGVMLRCDYTVIMELSGSKWIAKSIMADGIEYLKYSN
ncbi:hypothetical protein [Dysgonomonas termitidis]|uniref:Lipoprotein n=1 Tax=Dysgonomonas termitidis TaxID=1516126 RepID=A0ABV9KTW7_9BACT